MPPLPKDRFVSRRSALSGPYHVLPACVADAGEAAGEVLHGYSWGTALGYLLRRFGPPNMASDPDREIAAWMITTPDPDVHVACSTAASDYVSARFRAVASEKAAAELTALAFDPDGTARIEAVRLAVRRTIVDLLRTVSVRDVDLSILGGTGTRRGHLVPARESGAALPDFAYREEAFAVYDEIETMGGDAAALRRATRILKDGPLRSRSAAT